MIMGKGKYRFGDTKDIISEQYLSEYYELETVILPVNDFHCIFFKDPDSSSGIKLVFSQTEKQISHTLYFRSDFRAKKAKCDFIFDLLFSAQRGMFQRCRLPDTSNLQMVFCYLVRRRSRRKQEKYADIIGIFTGCTH